MQTQINSLGWNFTVIVDGDDIVVENVRATCFGGSDDPQDNGETASGISTKDDSVMGCALPVEGHAYGTQGTPLPRIPWMTPVEITRGSTTITVPLIDNGPAQRTGNGIDLTVAAARLFDPHATAVNFCAVVSYRVRGGTKFLNS